MNDVATMTGAREIVVEEVFPHTLDVIWKTLTTPALMGRWLKMEPKGFEARAGTCFTYQTTPAGEWDGVIRCQVLEAVPRQRLVYAWEGGHEDNVGYGAPLDTVVTFTLSATEAGTRVRLVHSGFVLPRNETAFTSMSGGWKGVLERIDALSAGRE
jgi:uncharacterized protein YndB with AHSA1/START domain